MKKLACQILHVFKEGEEEHMYLYKKFNCELGNPNIFKRTCGEMLYSENI